MPLCQIETFHLKMFFACRLFFEQINLVFMLEVLHEDSYETQVPGNSEVAYCDDDGDLGLFHNLVSSIGAWNSL